MAIPIDTSGMRFRPGAHEIKHDVPIFTHNRPLLSTVGMNPISTHEELPRVVYEKTQSMYDIVTPNFKKRSAAGEIFNNRMYSVEDYLDNPLIPLTSSGPDGEKHQQVITTSHNVLPPPFRIPPGQEGNVSNAAITAAYANVTANEGNTLLWIGELKESVAMFLQIGNGIKQLVQKTSSQRKKWAKGKLTVEEAQQLTLAILYGILPLEQQVTDFMDGLFRTKDVSARHTARGMNVKTTNQQYNLSSQIYVNGTMDRQLVKQYVSESQSIVVRAGVLFEYDVDTPWLSIILEPKSVVSTAYALARLSFVIDWFINVGSTLAAWAPSAGITELAAWKTITVETIQATSVVYGENQSGIRQGIGSGTSTRVRTEKWRVPISRVDLDVFPRLNVDLDLQKVLAMVLLFAKIKKTV